MSKVKDRYSMGWSDPRMPIFNQPLHLGGKRFTQFSGTVETEVLRNLWLVKWGQRGVLFEDVAALDKDDDVRDVMQELINRRQVSAERHMHPHWMEEMNYYVLTKDA
jgi:hypothetical protein